MKSNDIKEYKAILLPAFVW